VDAQKEVRVDEHAFERELNPGIKRPRLRIASSRLAGALAKAAVASAFVEELDERLHISARHRPAVREPGNP
jgi:hypothetical protein